MPDPSLTLSSISSLALCYSFSFPLCLSLLPLNNSHTSLLSPGRPVWEMKTSFSPALFPSDEQYLQPWINHLLRATLSARWGPTMNRLGQTLGKLAVEQAAKI